MNWSNNETALADELNKLAIFADNPLVVEGKSYAAFDAISDKYVCEFKKRNFESNHKYAIEGLIIERLKYDSLIEKSEFFKKEALYINKFTDDKIVIWNLTDMTKFNFDFKWHMKKMNKRTFQSKFNKTEKEIALLKPQDGKIYG